MGQPWGLSGPEFLALYGGALVVWCAIVVLVRVEVKAQRSPGTVAHVPDLYERAFLNGASDRVADTALAGLIDSGWVRVTRSRKLQRVRTSADDDVQREVGELVGRKLDLARLREAFRHSGFCGPVQQRLIDEGLLVTSGAHTVLRVLVWGFPLLALVAVVRGLNGVRLGYPVGYLLLELAATLIVWAIAAKDCGHPLRTRAGDAVRKPTTPGQSILPDTGENRRDRDSRIAEQAHLGLGPIVAASAVELVAQGGLGAHPDPTVARLLHTASSGGGAFGGGSSCGGGGGGGCGGGGAG